MLSFRIETKNQEMKIITRQVEDAVENSNVREGLCVVFCTHTTAGVTINESADPDVVSDLLLTLNNIFPDRKEYRHMEGNTSAHAKAMCVGSSVTIPIHDGRLALGRRQGIFFCEFGGPRNRQFCVQILSC